MSGNDAQIRVAGANQIISDVTFADVFVSRAGIACEAQCDPR
jgi:hypothetical protein